MIRTEVGQRPAAHEWLRARFRRVGSAESAVKQKAYMKSALSFHGVTSAEVRSAARELCDREERLDHDAVVELVDGLFRSEWFDVRSCGLVVLERNVKLLGPADLDWLIDLVRRGSCWAHVDAIATQLVGAVVRVHPKSLSRLPRWAKDESFWVRRTALLAQVGELRAGRGDFELFERIASPMVGEREFFIRKALGWVLRETSKQRPELAFRFLSAHAGAVSGLTLREGAKYLPAPMRAKVGLSTTESAA